ncbi:DUF1007 family protein [Ruegeria marina]|uniref:ABC-type uncharacterized transport system, substrate-binding protein n=1 Tax=Ruegeria marina TaxID=639004 RepID=A0A1G6TG48_9RHOB|nr:DUF1007 family protein [Ruegeria marina]SDD28132.1 ABC-type uncharacterized transport system, substrate-binding protein [Ruegeria marina]
MHRIALLLSLLLPAPLGAHPHVFVDTGVELIFDADQKLTHVRVTWAYDDFYSLIILEDMGLDPDGDGLLTREEEQQLAGFDAQWIEGYTGDLDIRLGDSALDLSGPLEPTATTEAGRIVTTHLRAVKNAPRLGGAALSVKPYDETYYTAYEVARPVTLTGRDDCTVQRFEPDIDGQLAQMQQMLLRIDADADLEELDIPLMGAEFATEIRVTCPVS